MKRSGKVILIIAVCLLVFGILLSGGAAIAFRVTGSHPISGRSLSPADVRTAHMDSIDRLSLRLLNEPIYIRTGGDVVAIEWSEIYSGQYRLTPNANSLSLSRQTSNNIGFGPSWFNFDFSWFGISSRTEDGSNRPVTVTIPEGMSLRSVDIAGADIRLEIDGIHARDIDISGANVIAELSNVDAGSIEVSGANTIVNLSQVTAADIDVSGANAEVSASIDVLESWGWNVSGLHAEARVNGELRSGRTVGTNNISVNGLNAVLDIWVR